MTGKDDDGRSKVFCSQCGKEVLVINGQRICPHGRIAITLEEYGEMMSGAGSDSDDPRDR